MTSLIIRPGKPEDIGPLTHLLARSYPRLLAADYASDVLEGALPKISRAQPALVTCGTYFVAFSGGLLVGGGGWTSHAPGQDAQGDQEDPSRLAVGHIRHFATDSDVVRQGIGTALMEQVLQSALENGVEILECLSTLTAVPFYRKTGFEVRAEIDVPLGEVVTFPAIRMVRKVGG